MEASRSIRWLTRLPTWQEHWFDHRQLLRLYHSDEYCAIYTDPGVRWAEVRGCPGSSM